MPSRSATTRPLGHLPPPISARADFAWTSKLIARDVKNMYQKTSISRVIGKLFGASTTAVIKEPPAAVVKRLPKAEKPPLFSKLMVKSEATPKPSTMTTAKSKHAKIPSVSTTIQSTTQPSMFTEGASPPSTGMTQPDAHRNAPSPLIQIPRTLLNNTFYDLMSDKLNYWYRSRESDLEPWSKDRWRTRGIAVFLRIAIELCASNHSHDQLGIRPSASDEDEFIRGILQLGYMDGNHDILSSLGLEPVDKISGMPAEVYSGNANTNAVRVDSTHSTFSPAFWQPTQNPDGTMNTSPSAVNLWAALLVALYDRDLTANIIADVMYGIMPELDTEEFLIRIGDPAQRLREGEEDMLREKLRPFLFPEYEQLLRQSCSTLTTGA